MTTDDLTDRITTLTDAYTDDQLAAMTEDVLESAYTMLLDNLDEHEAAAYGEEFFQDKDRLSANGTAHAGSFGPMLRGED